MKKILITCLLWLDVCLNVQAEEMFELSDHFEHG